MKPDLICVADFEREAKLILPRNALNYYKSGSDEEVTLCENVAAFKRLRLIPRVLRDVGGVFLGGSKILGQEVSSPICVAPTAMQKMAHDDGELATSRACVKNDTLMAVSTLSTVSIEEIVEKTPKLKRWLQLYIYKNLKKTAAFVKRAERCGYSAVAVTVDTPYLGKRRADERHRFALPNHLSLANFAQNESEKDGKAFRVRASRGSGLSEYVEMIQHHSLTWADIKWLKGQTNMKIVLKGIHCAEDAKLAVNAGVDAIWVSNHGGRQLDGVPATVEMLPDIVRAVQGSPVEVYVDGGVRNGSDVLKALALGANAVFIGRPVLWGLACGGEEGVSRVLQLLNDELRLSMALSGCQTLQDVNKSMIKHQSSFCHL